MSLRSKKLTLILCLAMTFLHGCSIRQAAQEEPVVVVTPPESSTPESEELEADLSVSEPSLEAEAPEPLVTAPIGVFDKLRAGFTFPEFNSADVQRYERWNAEHPTYLANLFKRATPYWHHIISELEKRDLPMELALLPAVESAFKSRAVSRSNAGGIWQFVPATGRAFGLRQDWWYDGRFDFLSATDAALDYLEQLNVMFDGDWFLTMAAYNAGPGTVRRQIKRNKRANRETNYASLKLRSETRRYVPKLIALKNIILDPEKYSVQLPSMEFRPEFAVIDLPGQIDLRKFAKASGIGASELRTLNAGFHRWATAPEGPHRLLIPIDKAEQVNKELITLLANSKVDYQRHTIERGDSLHLLSKRYGVSVSALRKANNLRGSTIRAGHTLMIPAGSRSPSYSITAGTNEDQNSAKKLMHTVQSGDTLWSISKRYKVGVKQLLDWNQLAADSVLSLNQQLLVLLY